MQEQRQYPRLPISNDLPVTDTNSGKVLGRMVNLSAGGMMLYVNNRVASHSVFQISFYLPEGSASGNPVKMGVESLWCSVSDNPNGFWVGFHVIDISEDDKQRLIDYTG